MHVADEDAYVARQEDRIDKLITRCEKIEDRIEQVLAQLGDEIENTSNELSMTHDYCEGLHYAIVEHGGYLRNGLGLNHDQRIHLTTLERANLVSARVMGTVEYMRAVRQR